MAEKAKEIAGTSTSKRKGESNDKSVARKRPRSGVLQFFEVAADVVEDEDEDDSDELTREFMDEVNRELEDMELKGKGENGKSQNVPFIPKEEELSDVEIEKLLRERCKPGSGYVTYAEDDNEIKTFQDRDFMMPSVDDPTIRRVKCMVGRERHAAFCLIHKYVELQSLGTKMQVIAGTSTSKRKGEADDKSVARKRPRSNVLQLFEVAADVVEDEDDELTRAMSGLQFFDVAADDVEDEDIFDVAAAYSDFDDTDVEVGPPFETLCSLHYYIGKRVGVRIRTDNTMWAKGTILQFEEDLDCYEVRFLSSNLSDHADGNKNVFFIEDRVALVLSSDIRPCQPRFVSIMPMQKLEVDPCGKFETWSDYCKRRRRTLREIGVGRGMKLLHCSPLRIIYLELEKAMFQQGELVEYYDGKGVWKVGTIAFDDIFEETGMKVKDISYVCTNAEDESEPELRLIRKRKQWVDYMFLDY